MSNFRYKKKSQPLKLEFGIYNKKDTSIDRENISESAPTKSITLERQILKGSFPIPRDGFSTANKIDNHLKERICSNLKAIYHLSKSMESGSLVDLINNELIVSFNYSKKLVERFKGLDKCERAWDPDLKSWRVFLGAFDDVFDILGKGFQLKESAYKAIIDFLDTPYYSHIAKSKLGKLIVRESWFKELKSPTDTPLAIALPTQIPHEVSSYTYIRKPLSHQLIGISYLFLNPFAGLFDEMGCGKTYQIVNAIKLLMEHSVISKVLIVVPKSLIYTWLNECQMAGLTTVTKIIGPAKAREKSLENLSSVVLTSYDTMRIEEESFIDFLKNSDGLLVFDESQKLKNLQAEVTRSAIGIRNHAKRCIIATGTPIANRPLDLFSQYLIMDKGATFGNNFQIFKNTFCNIEKRTISVNNKKIEIEKFISTKNVESLNQKLSSTSIRRLKSEVLDLPTVVYKDYVVEMAGHQLKMYRDEIKEFMRSTIDMNQSSSISHHMLKLNQISSNPLLIDKSFKGKNAKLEELKNVLDDILIQENKKIIIWTHYVGNVTTIKDHCPNGRPVSVHTGEMTLAERNRSIEEFRNNPECKIFIATVQSAKEGLTLLPADGKSTLDTMLYFDLDFNAGSYLQSQARFHRIGQSSEKCLIIHLLAKDSIDYYIKKNIIEKIETNKDVLKTTQNPKVDIDFIKSISGS